MSVKSFNFHGEEIRFNLATLQISVSDILSVIANDRAQFNLQAKFSQWVGLDQVMDVIAEGSDGCGECGVCTIWLLEFVPTLIKWLTWQHNVLDPITISEEEYSSGFKDVYWAHSDAGHTTAYLLSGVFTELYSPWDDRCEQKTGVSFIPLEGEFQYRLVHVIREIETVGEVGPDFMGSSTRSVTLRLGVEPIIKSANLGALLHTLSR